MFYPRTNSNNFRDIISTLHDMNMVNILLKLSEPARFEYGDKTSEKNANALMNSRISSIF